MTHYTPGWPPLALLLNDSPPTSKAEKVEVKRRTPEQEEADRKKDVPFADCGNEGCGWRGPLSETCRLGSIGPLCPRCREVAEPDAPPSKPATQAGEWMDCHEGMPDLAPGTYEWRNKISHVTCAPGACSLRQIINSDFERWQYRLLTPAQEAGKMDPVYWLSRRHGVVVRRRVGGGFEMWHPNDPRWTLSSDPDMPVHDASVYEPIYTGDTRIAGWDLDSQGNPRGGA